MQVTPNVIVSIPARHAIEDMVELEMYLLAQAQQAPWPLFPRGTKRLHEARSPHSMMVEFSVVSELVSKGIIEATSNRTFVVSTLGRDLYDREVKLNIELPDVP